MSKESCLPLCRSIPGMLEMHVRGCPHYRPAESVLRVRCGHKCHAGGLNPWVEECPVCGCENPKYDPRAVSDIQPRQPHEVGNG